MAHAQTAHSPAPPDAPSSPPGSSEAPPYQLLRYDEDYTYLRDSFKRKDALDSVKFIPLDKSQDRYLTLGGEAREKFDDYRQYPLTMPPTRAYFLQRYMLHADLHLGKSLRFFGQLQSDHQGGYDGGMMQPQAPEVDRLDINQAFADYKTPLGTDALTARGGRQEINYGDGRLLSPRASPNVRQSFDGALLSAQGRLRVDGFAFRAVTIGPNAFDNPTNAGQDVWGIYAAVPASERRPGADFYFLGYDRRNAGFSRGTAGEQRLTLGSRLSGKNGWLDYDWEAAYQSGQFGSGKVGAYLVATETGYTFERMPLTPRLGLRADVASGDQNPLSHSLGTFNPLYGRGDYYGEINLFSESNLRDIRPSLDLYSGRKVDVTVDSFFLWRDSVRDGLYTPGLTPAVPATDSHARYVGTLRAAQVVWQMDRHFALTFNYTYLVAGSYLCDAGGRDIRYTTGSVDFLF